MTTTEARPTFAEVTLANDLRKLEEDYLALEHRAQRPTHITGMNARGIQILLGGFRTTCRETRTALVAASISFEAAVAIRDMLEAAFHVARRALNGIPAPTEAHTPLEVPC